MPWTDVQDTVLLRVSRNFRFGSPNTLTETVSPEGPKPEAGLAVGGQFHLRADDFVPRSLSSRAMRVAA